MDATLLVSYRDLIRSSGFLLAFLKRSDRDDFIYRIAEVCRSDPFHYLVVFEDENCYPDARILVSLLESQSDCSLVSWTVKGSRGFLHRRSVLSRSLNLKQGTFLVRRNPNYWVYPLRPGISGLLGTIDYEASLDDMRDLFSHHVCGDGTMSRG